MPGCFEIILSVYFCILSFYNDKVIKLFDFKPSHWFLYTVKQVFPVHLSYVD